MNRIKEIRKSKGLALNAVAERANTTPQQVQRLERGDRRLTTEWIERLADALECEPADIVPGIAGKKKDLLGMLESARQDFETGGVIDLQAQSLIRLLQEKDEK